MTRGPYNALRTLPYGSVSATKGEGSKDDWAAVGRGHGSMGVAETG